MHLGTGSGKRPFWGRNCSGHIFATIPVLLALFIIGNPIGAFSRIVDSLPVLLLLPQVIHQFFSSIIVMADNLIIRFRILAFSLVSSPERRILQMFRMAGLIARLTEKDSMKMLAALSINLTGKDMKLFQ